VTPESFLAIFSSANLNAWMRELRDDTLVSALSTDIEEANAVLELLFRAHGLAAHRGRRDVACGRVVRQQSQRE
jgi:hypothetical protein